MVLRDHPLMSYHGMPNWPPVWTYTSGPENKRPRGEIGVLKAVAQSTIQPADRCFLYIEHEGSTYIGCLLFDQSVFCHQVVKLLQGHCNLRIAEIGNLEVGYTL
jgi:hypothetical protein